MANPQYLVKIADGSAVPQMTVAIADGSKVPQLTMRVAAADEQPQLTIAIADGSNVPQMTVVLDGYAPTIDYAARVLALSPIAYYQLNGDATDSSGNGYDGAATGAAFGATGIGDGNTAAAFDGTGDYIDISALAPKFSGAAGSIVVWGKTSAWADSTARYLVRIAANGSNQVFIQKTNTPNMLFFRRQGGGSARSVSDTSLSGTADYFSAILTWDTTANEMKAYIDGLQVGTTQGSLTTFTGTPAATTTVIGAFDTSGASGWIGSLAHVAIFDRALTAAEALSLGVL